MDVMISGRHVAVTDAMREHARERVERLAHISPHLMRARVALTIEGDRQSAEVVATMRGKGEVVAKAESHDMYLSIDQAVAKLEKRLQKIEDKYRQGRVEARRRRSLGHGRIIPPEPEATKGQR